MREQNICGLPRHKSRRRDLSRVQTTADLVNREFVRDGPNQLQMTDITEHPTREEKLYCCAVLDARSRKVTGWPRRPSPDCGHGELGTRHGHRKPPSRSVATTD